MRGGVAYGGGGHAGVVRGLDARDGVLDHEAVRRGHAEEFGGLEEHLGVGLGAADIRSVGHRVEVVAEADALEDELCVLARGADGEDRKSVV